MRTPLRRLAGWGLAVGATVALAALSRAPQRAGDGAAGRLRLSWSGQPARVEVCRDLTDDELRSLPQHMRQRTICEGRAARYRLRVTVDESTLADELVTGGGLRSDRPIYLFREFPLTPGSHALAVEFDLADDANPQDEAAPPSRRLDALPSSLMLDTTLTLPPRTVVLVTYDPDRQRLAIRSR